MIKVERPEISDEEGAKLIALAKAKREKLIQAFGEDPKPQIDDALYKRYKEYLLKAFNDKCAYCEAVIPAAQPGDVEHFRPKGRVVDEQFKPVRVRYDKWGEINHPGYFWLAYEWKNLLPSCIDCNRYRLHGEGGAGKADRFPVAGFRASLPGEEDQEEPLLIDPTLADPSEHLEFFPDGKVRAKTKIGEETIDNIGLNIRESLVSERAAAYDAARNAIELLLQMNTWTDAQREARLREQVNGTWEGRRAYSAIGRLALEHVRQAWRRRNVPLPLPWPAPGE
jgi:uncharacterized protein (TIGR02646 family)